ncbi:MAG: gliding motility-associated C-terminal domain-containing protein [Candidatus Pseudobacter hemicellulosilyticus]|uniref:Gliding motility-associated C-terminal domain-containing protein n=1 Tax=Candidatus Pseudobacter hemicellulosilyticus TaxID=3121375 RepID=A0AAJ5WS22_9BACT|nr:MAG: gliding motility-associated C-terminal domain-containing protein [Pseudobacter sp.]
MFRRICWLLLLLSIAFFTKAQTCTNLGQTPSTAFPVCGTTSFHQTSVPVCSLPNLPVPSCPGDYPAKNPYWYRFDCYQDGSLGFVITPNDIGDDYDWMLYDITGRDPGQVFNNAALIVTGNWSGTSGLTGAADHGVNYIGCMTIVGEIRNTFSKMPTLIKGHTYMLMISHFTNSQSGYSLSFGGGTALITDPTLPGLKMAEAHCSGARILVNLSKATKCASLAADGSDFTISGGYTITGATGIGCSSSFDMTALELTVNAPLAPGSYTVSVKKGSDGNTLLDNCDNIIAEGASLSITFVAPVPTRMDSLTTPGCAPNTLELVFKKQLYCSSIAADGSDFRLSGPAPVSITGISTNCNAGFTDKVILQLSKPIEKAGSYQLQLVQGNDGNTIIDECKTPTPPGDVLAIIAKDTVNAAFSTNILYGCKSDTVEFSHDGRNGVSRYTWDFNGQGNSFIREPRFVFPTFGEKLVTLAVNNGLCYDTVTQLVNLDNAIAAGFTCPEFLCPEDMAVFTEKSLGRISSYHWEFGDGFTSSQANPVPRKYSRPVNRQERYTVSLIVGNDKNCFDTLSRQLLVLNNCTIAVPNAFTPNNDGKNDQLAPLNGWKAADLDFRIFNRYGQLIFQTSDWTRKWDGNFNGKQQASGVYVWMLRYRDRDSGQQVQKKGTTVLIR